MIAYRIADSRHPIFNPTGAMLHGGRWNSPGRRVIYASEIYSGALLEVLVHANLAQPPRNHRVVRIHIPDSITVETVQPSQVPGWNAEDMLASRSFGDAWIASRRTVVLRVPGVVTQGREYNLICNADHPLFPQIYTDPPEPVFWDMRLFES